MKSVATGQKGWAMISSTSPLYGMALVFGGGSIPMYDEDITSQLSMHLTIAHMDSSGWISTAMLCNPNASTAQVTLTFYPKADAPVATQSLSIPAMGSVQYNLDVFSSSGSVQIDSSQPIAGFMLYDGRAFGYNWLGGLSIVPTQEGCVASGSITGAVQNSSHQPLANTTVTMRNSSGNVVATTLTDANGNYEISLSAGEGYSLTFSHSGYLDTVYRNVDVPAEGTAYLETVILVSQSETGNGAISGYITNSVTGEQVAEVTLSLRSGVNTTSGSVVATASSDSQGLYTFNSVPAGVYTAQTSKSGFIVSYFTVFALGSMSVPNQNESITPESIGGADGVIRVNLTWGATPEDLDSHMTGPLQGGDRFHVYYSDDMSSDGLVSLDTDDTDSYGPENITISEILDGVYQYGVYDYSNGGAPNSTEMGQSNAKVRVYNGDALITQFSVPNQAGIFWHVFELENGVITPVNTMSGSIDISRIGVRDAFGNAEDGSELKLLPKK